MLGFRNAKASLQRFYCFQARKVVYQFEDSVYIPPKKSVSRWRVCAPLGLFACWVAPRVSKLRHAQLPASGSLLWRPLSLWFFHCTPASSAHSRVLTYCDAQNKRHNEYNWWFEYLCFISILSLKILLVTFHWRFTLGLSHILYQTE